MLAVAAEEDLPASLSEGRFVRFGRSLDIAPFTTILAYAFFGGGDQRCLDEVAQVRAVEEGV